MRKLLKHSADFANFYDEIQSKQLFDDIIDARVIFHYKEVPNYVLKKLATYGNDVCPNLTAAIRILITLATSIASCERNFSKRKLIKSYLRSTMGKDRLNSLVSVESDLLDKIDMNNTIDISAAKKYNVKQYELMWIVTYLHQFELLYFHVVSMRRTLEHVNGY